MAKFLATLVLVLFSSMAFAKGTLSLKPAIDPTNGEKRVMMGLSVYQGIPQIMGQKLGYNGWVGGMVYEEDKIQNWVKIDNSIETYIGPAAIGIGGAYDHKPYNTNEDEATLYLNFKMTLWK